MLAGGGTAALRLVRGSKAEEMRRSALGKETGTGNELDTELEE